MGGVAIKPVATTQYNQQRQPPEGNGLEREDATSFERRCLCGLGGAFRCRKARLCDAWLQYVRVAVVVIYVVHMYNILDLFCC